MTVVTSWSELVFSGKEKPVVDSKTLTQSSKALPMQKLLAFNLANSEASSCPFTISWGNVDGFSETDEDEANGDEAC
jgi:hypothetical protein